VWCAVGCQFKVIESEITDFEITKSHSEEWLFAYCFSCNFSNQAAPDAA